MKFTWTKVLAALGIGGAVIYFSHPRIVCHYSDAELIEIVAGDVLRKQKDSLLIVRETGESDFYQVTRYESLSDFMALNKDCCRISQSLPDVGAPTGFQRLYYDFRGYVLINSDLQLTDAAGARSVFEIPTYVTAVNGCGDEIQSLTWWD